MLVQFSVANFKSIKDKITFSMATEKVTEAEKYLVFETGYNSIPYVNNVSAVYGPNGAGKSNLFEALNFFQFYIMTSSNINTPHSPLYKNILDLPQYNFSESSKKMPSEFEIVFIYEENLYQYGFSLYQMKVQEEWLFVTPRNKKKQKTQEWFTREGISINVSDFVTGEKDSWKTNTRSDSLFLSTAVANNSKQLKLPFDWIGRYLRIVMEPESIGDRFSVDLLQETNEKNNIVNFLKSFDIGIEDLGVHEFDEKKVNFPSNMPKNIHDELLSKLKNEKLVYAMHSCDDGSLTALAMGDESMGTQRLFQLSGPLLDVLKNGYTLLIDEIHNSLHPFIVHGIIDLFNNKEVNKKNAQLIFITHDTDSMNYLKRDQIWLMSRSRVGGSQLESIADYTGRKDEAVEKRYHSGRYGALPNIRFRNE